MPKQRYDDEHRGPGVVDALPLSRCWTELQTVGDSWPMPSSLPPGMVQLAQTIPQAERDDWLRRQANSEEADRLIIDGVRSGGLPLWVRPIGEGETPVAPEAILEIDRAILAAGIYRPHNDRGWLFGRPLFVKRHDWGAFLAQIIARKGKRHDWKTAGQQGEGDSDLGWIVGLPPGWIDCFIAARRLYRRLAQACEGGDPAPWHHVQDKEYWGPHFGKEPDQYAFDRKLEERVAATFQRAFVGKELSPSWFDGSGFHLIPLDAFVSRERLHLALLDGGLEIDPLWPNEWQQWSGLGWALPYDQFAGWLASRNALASEGLPLSETELPLATIHPLFTNVPQTSSHLGGRVSLSEAVSWIAFDFALDAKRLERALRWERLANGDLQLAQRQLAAGVETLLSKAANGQVSLYARHLQSLGQKGVTTAKIDPLKLEDYRMFGGPHEDALYYGSGIRWRLDQPNASRLENSDRTDHFSNVTVNLAELLAAFRGPPSTVEALLMPIPVQLPEVGPVLGIEEALSWLANNRPVSGVEVWTNDAGDLQFRGVDGQPIESSATAPSLAASRHIYACDRLRLALSRGNLLAYVAPKNELLLAIPALYWNGEPQDYFGLTYRAKSQADPANGCPIMLDRRAFDRWRRSGDSPDTKGGIPANRQLNHEKIRDQAKAMKAERPQISLGAAAASIVADLPPNPTTGKPRDQRGIERIIAPLWGGK